MGCTALTVGGSTGEGAGFSPEEVRAVVTQTRGRVPVIAGAIPDTTREAVSLGKVAREAGSDALQITPPHYLFPPGPEETVDYYCTIGQATGLPIVVYNVVPWATIDVPTLVRLLDLPQVCGVKQSGGDIHKLSELLYVARGKASILTAVDDLLYPSFALGADGAVAAILAAVPTLCVALFDAVQRGDHAAAPQTHNRLVPVWMALSGPNLPARVKVALKLQGRNGGWSRRPMIIPSGDDIRRIREALERVNLVAVA